jgi:integrase
VAGRQDRLDAIVKQRIVSGMRIARLRLLRLSDGAFRQTLEHEVIQRAMGREIDRRLDPVAREPSAAADANRLHSGNTPSIVQAIVMRTDDANRKGAVYR